MGTGFVKNVTDAGNVVVKYKKDRFTDFKEREIDMRRNSGQIRSSHANEGLITLHTGRRSAPPQLEETNPSHIQFDLASPAKKVVPDTRSETMSSESDLGSSPDEI